VHRLPREVLRKRDRHRTSTKLSPRNLQTALVNILLGAKCSTHGIDEKPEVKRPLGRPRPRWEDNIRTDLREIWWEGVDWMDLVQNKNQWWVIVNVVMNFRVS
jgi:hypothetical protein